MALCSDCGTALPDSTKDCPACGARRQWAGREREAAAVSVASFPAMDSELTIAEVHLVAAAMPKEGRLDPGGAPSAADAPAADRRVGRVLAIICLILVCAAVVLILGSLVADAPWS